MKISFTNHLKILGYSVTYDNSSKLWTAIKGLHCVSAASLKEVLEVVQQDLVGMLKK